MDHPVDLGDRVGNVGREWQEESGGDWIGFVLDVADETVVEYGDVKPEKNGFELVV